MNLSTYLERSQICVHWYHGIDSNIFIIFQISVKGSKAFVEMCITSVKIVAHSFQTETKHCKLKINQYFSKIYSLFHNIFIFIEIKVPILILVFILFRLPTSKLPAKRHFTQVSHRICYWTQSSFNFINSLFIHCAYFTQH